MALVNSIGDLTHLENKAPDRIVQSIQRKLDVKNGLIKTSHATFDIPLVTYQDLTNWVFGKYGKVNQKTYVFRILVNALVEGIIDFDDIEKKLDELPKIIDV